ncbi:hypothetical protein P1X14_13275 [Sphingomonas sp. AOB5]|uniref:hypothetical protein n=1 Tax=Sphingomonas sp. AOB5 TaxID=3034017 RepID=UPI0023F7B636|nr:hypothetical protein [Sphingomonas sp. AOB5]MDF7776224.1 hypothetical protein [Sphingomonas sp. AOB5]
MTDTSNAMFRYEPGAPILSARPLNNIGWAVAAALVLVPIALMFVAGALTPGQGAGWPLLTIIVTGTSAYFGALHLLKTKSVAKG